MSTQDQKSPHPITQVKRLAQLVWGFLRGYFFMVGLVVTCLPVILLLILQNAQVDRDGDHSVSLPDDGFVLHMHYDGSIVRQSASDPFALFSNIWKKDQNLALPEWQQQMRAIAVDKRVKGLIISTHTLRGSWADYSEARRALVALREKRPDLPVVFHLAQAQNGLYYLASAGSRISLLRAGGLETPGPVFTLMYFRQALEKIGVEFEVLQAGKFKSALESFSRDAPSQAALQVFLSLEKDLREHLVNTVALARDKDVEIVNGWFKQGFFSGPEAAEAGMVDDLQFEDELVEEVLATLKQSEVFNQKQYRAASTRLNKKLQADDDQSIGLIEAEGEIHLSASGGEKSITPSGMRKQIDYMLEHDDVKAVVMRIDSPGGSALASDMIWRDVQRLTAVKPVIVSMGSVAASGGYYMASGATRIVADAPTITGSIGVIAAFPNVAAATKKYGINFSTITQSDRLRIYDPSASMGPFDRALYENQIRAIYDLFLQRVATGRNMNVGLVHELAQGRVYTGTQALELNLVDQIGGLQEAFQLAKSFAKLDPNKLYPIEQYRDDHQTLLHCLLDKRSLVKCSSYIGTSVLPPNIGPMLEPEAKLFKVAQNLRRWLEHERALTWLPVQAEMQ